MNRDELIALCQDRVKDAKVLLNGHRYQGAYYLCGYAVECGLKACIAKQVAKYDFPDKKLANDAYTHNLASLVKVAGLEPHLGAHATANPTFATNWAVVKDWSEQYRYDRTVTSAKARDIYAAVTGRSNGILKWLRQHW
jgi:uncharacterized protein YjaG (DUF416 family)